MEGEEFGGDDELEELMRELDGDDDMEEPVMEDDDMFDDSEEVPMEESDEDVTDDEIMEYLLHEEDDEMSGYGADEETQMEISRLRTENKKLSKNLRETLLTVAQMKSTLNEVNLLNSK